MSTVTPVQLFLDSFLVGLLPNNNETITRDVILSGTDGTVITVVANSGTVYKEQPKKVFEATPNQSILFKFHFPVGTTTNPTSTVFTTTDNSVYTFSTGNGMVKDGDTYKKQVTEGTIEIKPPDVKPSTGPSGPTTFVNNSDLKESALGDSIFGDLKDSPFYNILFILYELLMDMVVVVIFWLLFVSISCWLKVPSEFLYPNDKSKFPFQYFNTDDKKTGGATNTKSETKPETGDTTVRNVYDYLKQNNSIRESCTVYNTTELNTLKDKQTEWFNKIDDYYAKNENGELLKILYPELLTHHGADANQATQHLQELCGIEFGLMECVSYSLNIIRFHSHVSCNSVLSNIHSSVAVLSNKILNKITEYKMYGVSLISIIFAVFLYFLLLNSGSYNEQVIQMTGLQFEDSNDPQTIMINQFKHLIIYVITCCLLIFMPLFIMLFIASAGTTFYVLCKQLFSSFNGFILCISAISLYFAMINYATLALIVTGMMPLETVMEGTGGMFAGMSAIFSIFSVGVPLLTSGAIAGYISTKLITTSFTFMNLESMAETMKNCISSLVILSLFLLVRRVSDKLGETYSAITVMIIILMGIIFASGNA